MEKRLTHLLSGLISLSTLICLFKGSGELGIENIILSGLNGQNIPFQIQQDLISIP